MSINEDRNLSTTIELFPSRIIIVLRVHKSYRKVDCVVTENVAVYHPDWNDKSSLDGLEVFFVSPNSPASLESFDFIVVLGGAMLTCPKEMCQIEAVRRERELFNALESGSVVCATFMWNNDPLSFRIANRIGIGLQGWDLTAAIEVKRSEFLPFIKRFGVAGARFYSPTRTTEYEFDDVICRSRDGVLFGFVKKVGRGVLILLACEVELRQYHDSDFMKEFLGALIKSSKAYGTKVQYRVPRFVESYRFPNETVITSKIAELQKELAQRENSLAKYQKLKEILWFRDDELVDSAIGYFNEIGIRTKRDEIREEDFWLIEANKETVIVEVKGLDRNLTRPHISQLDEHRGAREKPDDFPALLIVNSFNKANSLKEKDEPISPNEIKKAAQMDILLMRTLDLCNAYYLIEKGSLDAATLLKLIKAEKGWLYVSTFGFEIKNKG